MATIRNIVKRRIESLIVFWYISRRNWKSLHFKIKTDKDLGIFDYNSNKIKNGCFWPRIELRLNWVSLKVDGSTESTSLLVTDVGGEYVDDNYELLVTDSGLFVAYIFNTCVRRFDRMIKIPPCRIGSFLLMTEYQTIWTVKMWLTVRFIRIDSLWHFDDQL